MYFAKFCMGLHIALLTSVALAQYGTPASLQAELKPGDDLVFATSPQTTVQLATLGNALYAPAGVASQPGQRYPALILFHTCGGISEHIQYWAQEALKEGYVVLIPNGMRGLQSDCGSPPKLSNARFLKDALDGAAHLAVQPKRRTGHRSKAPVQWHLYPNAIHCWDCKEKDGFSKIAFNGQRVSYRFDAAVTQDSRERVFGFLRKSLQAN